MDRVNKILYSDHPLCRDDVIFVLGYIKKKVADADPRLTDLSQPRLLRNFHCFAEAAMQLLSRQSVSGIDAARMREWLREAAHGLDR